jgi:hypothetical protein
MKKRAVIFIKCLVYTGLIAGLSSLLYFDERKVEILKLKYRLKMGTPEQKEQVLNVFMDRHPVELVPSAIGAILDNSAYPWHGRAAWGRIYHKAATAMCQFAQSIDGKTQEQRGLHEYSFHNDAGVATVERRIEVHRNWREWWDKNRSLVKSR